LAGKGIFTVRHAVFRLRVGRLISALYNPASMMVYEVKTGRKSVEPTFRARLTAYASLLDEGLASKVVYVNVAFANSAGFSKSQAEEIGGRGFETLEI
jgi:hypothetical protein